MNYREIVDNMSLEDLCGQVLAFDIGPHDSYEYVMDLIKKTHPGGLFFHQKTKERRGLITLEQEREFKRYAEELSGIPCIMLTDVEHGPGSYDTELPFMPNPMAWGACNDEKLIERAGELTAQICRKYNIQYSLSPVVDMNSNFRDPVICTLSVSSDMERVIRIAGAYLKGMQKNGYMAGCVKHFPGGGEDERNPHFMTTVNDMSKEEWMSTYGVIYKEMFKLGAATLMPGHVCCPAFQTNDYDECGLALPATLSKELLTDLLRGELGFEGLIISDAMSMIGACAVVPEGKLGIEFLKAGGDFILFPEPEEYDRILEAVKSGELPIERLKDAVMRILKLKEDYRLFEGTAAEDEIGDITDAVAELNAISEQIANRAVKIVRDIPQILPVTKENGKAFIVELGDECDYSELYDEFKLNGWSVDSEYLPNHVKMKNILKDYDLVLVVTHAGNDGASMRFGWRNNLPLWRGYVMHHPKVVFVGLDDPYKLFDFPYAKTYVNTFGDAPCLQRALVRTVLGKNIPTAKNPVSFKGFFELEK